MGIEISSINQPNYTAYPSKSTESAIDTKVNMSEYTEKIQSLPSSKELLEKKDTSYNFLSISEKAIIDAIEKANKAVQGINTSFEFSIHEKTREIMIKVLNKETKEVIREIPPEKTLDMVAKLWEMAGIIVDRRG
ncbi:flagellar protein FlaG [Petroclostridium sp. X23]|uniref:flagellar protein FlaG n=1 Tax=Petroclostridium sp. X23 TaxID=3045146 RepID=UPI0024AD1637|nr:flagellar protein FlaG [Petroclostridium sp. X23]WHH61507.1 flagellar protein FlaG [Petroclostridium sp. X23]